MTEQVGVKMRIPSELAELARPRGVEEELRLLVALELYREGRVSLGKAAELDGLSLREFLYELRSGRVPLNYDLEELEVGYGDCENASRRQRGLDFMKAVVDTSVLIALSNIGRLGLLRELFSNVIVPKAVAEEYGEPLPSWIGVLEVKHKHLVQVLHEYLHRGEAEAIKQ